MAASKGLDQELLSAVRFRRVFERLEQKALADFYLLFSGPVFEECTLGALLRAQGEFFYQCKNLLRTDQLTWSTGVKIVLRERKDREIYVNCWPDRVVLMLLAQILIERIPLQDGVYSFRKGGSYHQALQALQKFLRSRDLSKPIYILKRDVKKYGDSMNRKILAAEMSKEIPGFSESKVAKRLILQSFEIAFRNAGTQEEPKPIALGIPAGSPLVPPLENFYLKDLDRSLSAFKNSFYGRYGDDFVFVSDNLEHIAEARSEIDRILTGLELKVNVEKSRDWVMLSNRNSVLSPDSESDEAFQKVSYFTWLGHTLDSAGDISCPPEEFLRIKGVVKSDIERAFHKVKRISKTWAQSEQDRFLKTALRRLTLVKKRLNILGALVIWQQRPQLLGDFDRSVWANVVRGYRSILKQPKKLSLARARSLRYVSVVKQTTVKQTAIKQTAVEQTTVEQTTEKKNASGEGRDGTSSATH